MQYTVHNKSAQALQKSGKQRQPEVICDMPAGLGLQLRLARLRCGVLQKNTDELSL